MVVSQVTLLSIPILLASLTSAISLDCEHIRTQGVKFDFHELGGPHPVTVIDENRPPAIYNTTWTVDICKPLERLKDIDKADQCQQGSYVCGIVTSYNSVDDPEKKHVQVDNVISVAGNFVANDGKGLEPQYQRLKSQDKDEEGLEVTLNGGTYNKKNQRAIIKFICDKERSGKEVSRLRRREDDEDDKKDEDKEKNSKNSLSFVSYGEEEGTKNVDILRLDWRTKYACEDYISEEGDDNSSGGWGFFTWLIVLLFLGTAAYLIFGSWLNYNRYGARGWDLLPHGDTIRDIPYLFKDWSRKVVDTVSGGGSRGGYSAV